MTKEVEQFLPGLPNEVVLNQIFTKLPWRAFHILSSVSPCWREAIQSREVFNARVCSKSTDTLVVLHHDHPDDEFIHAISLYSTTDDSWHQLPKFPFTKRGYPQSFFGRSCQCVALDGKLYVLGGEEDDYKDSEDSEDSDDSEDSNDSEDSDDGQQVDYEFQDGSNVYVFDLVGQRGWKKCANLPEPRCGFACGVLNGKVYVFGGVVPVRYSESLVYDPKENETESFVYDPKENETESFVYDPKEDEWVSIAPMISERSGHHVVAVGDEFWVHGGKFGQKGVSAGAKFIEVYHPGKDKWEFVEPERCHESERLFTVKGKLFLMTPLGIYRREEPSKNKFWKRLQSISLPDNGFDNGFDADESRVIATQVVNGELVALIRDGDIRKTEGVLFRSEGFCTEKEEIELEIVAREIVEEHFWFPHLMCSIEL